MENMNTKVEYKNGSIVNTFEIFEHIPNCVNVISITCNSNGLKNLKGISRFENLETLEIKYNDISNLEELSNCTKLKKLSCKGNKIENLNGLQNCKNLESLFCEDNRILTLSFLQFCPNLKNLDCSGNCLRNLNGLENCTNLINLYACENFINNIDGISKCINLENLWIFTNNLNTLPLFLTRMNRITSLHCSDNFFNYFDLHIEIRNILYDLGHVNEHQNNTSYKIYDDGQNTHNSYVHKSIQKSIINLLRDKNIPNDKMQDLIEFI